MPLSMEEYLNKARQMYDPGYNERVASTNNAANTELTNQDNQIGTINKNYDLSVKDNKQTTALNQNSFAGNTLNRGMGRSSIAVTGLADIANQGQEKEVRINNERTGKLDAVEALKNTIRANLQNTLTGMKSSYESGISSTAQEMFNRDQDYERQVAEQEKQRAWQAEQTRIAAERQAEQDRLNREWQAEQDRIAYERQLAAAAASKKSSGGSSGSSRKSSSSSKSSSKGNNATTLAWQELQRHMDSGDPGAWLSLNEKDLKSDVGTTEYNKMKAAYDTYLSKLQQAQSTARGNAKQEFLDASQGYSLYNQ